MKTLKTLIFVTLILLAASCKKEDVNRLPSKPVLLEPENGAVTGSDTVTFKWQCTDREGDKIVYTFYISSDSVNWDNIDNINYAGFNLPSKSSPGGRYFPYVKGQKYYWKVKAENSFPNSNPKQEGGESVSEVSYFYTAPPGVGSLRESSGHQFVNLYWTDPQNLDHVEIIFTPQVSSIAQPVNVAVGVGKVELSGFENETIYTFFVRAYDKLNHTSEPDTVKAMPLLPIFIHDVDFNIYGIVKIGTQTWMSENLRATRYNDGTPFLNGYGEIIPASRLTGSKSDIYGLYYFSSIVKGGANHDKNPCPCGYHVPSDEEWITLERYLGMPEEDIYNTGIFFIRGGDECIGSMLKATTGWSDYNGASGNGVDLFGFNLKPAGCIYFYMEAKVEEGMGTTTYLLTSTGQDFLTDRYFSSGSKGIGRGNMAYGASVRCVKD